MEKGLVFDIHRGTTHDGPGMRTTVFLKGCPPVSYTHLDVYKRQVVRDERQVARS